MKNLPQNPFKARQKGVALITMLLIFTLVVILISSAVARMSLDIRKTGYHLQRTQAYQYALGGEALARQLLFKDWQQDKAEGTADHQGDAWYKEFQFQPDNGSMRVIIRDLESRFNLNNLIDSDGKAQPQLETQLQRLLQQLLLPTNASAQIIDWLDTDTQPRGARSEDVYYLSQEPAYRSADGPIADVSELRALTIFEAKELETLLPELAALPPGTPINPNTASKAVLASLHKDLKAEQVISGREQLPKGFTSNQEFLAHPSTAGIDFSDINIDVHSQYFEVWTAAKFQEQTVYLRTLIWRDPDTGELQTLHRSQQRPSGIFTPVT